MNSAQGVPPKKEFFIGVLLTFIVVFFINVLIPDAKDDRFRLIFSGFTEGEIKRVVINIGDSTLDFSNPKLDFLPNSKPNFKFVVPSETGVLNLTITVTDGTKYSLSNIEFRSGQANYITKQENSVIYVKSHWQ